ncbi:MAG: hypothetical protein AAGC67_12940 [Myxococcota bacterium]
MRQSQSTPNPRDLPKPVTELCAHLEARKIASYSHGEGLLHDLRIRPLARRPSRSLLCEATPEALLRALPRAVVSAEGGRRFTQATPEGPVDLVPCGEQDGQAMLRRFGLAPYAFAFRPRDESWLDPFEARTGFEAGELDLVPAEPDRPSAFEAAPRRYWIAARLIAEHDLRPTATLTAAAQAAFAEAAPRLPQGAPARRELTRILDTPRPGLALAFLRAAGVLDFLVPGTQAKHADRIDRLPALPALRWAAWLRGGATASAMIRFRVPHGLARRVERLQSSHPLDRAVSPTRDAGLRKLIARVDEDERAALFAWRRLEIAEWPDREEAARVEARLVEIEARIEKIRSARERSGEVRALALDGTAVMHLLGAGPGRHVGQALDHLARFVAADPTANEKAALETELVAWAKANTNLLDGE